MNKQDLPTNERGETADQTVEAVREQSRQFTQQEADYQPDGGVEDNACGLCYFWQGGGQCQVVGGEISQSGLSDLYINKEAQETAMGQGEDEMSKDTNGKRETKAFSVGECKIIDEDQGIVEHLVAVMGNVDLGDDVIHQGAFTKTVTERGRKIKVVDSHNYNSAMDAIGVPLMLWEVDRSGLPPEVLLEFPTATGGLMAKTQFLMDTEMGSEIFKRIKAGAIDQYSIGYDALDYDYAPMSIDGSERTVRNLRTIKLYEYSPVVFAMNEATTTLNAKDEAGDGTSEPPQDTVAKEMTPDGPRSRLGDVLQGSIHKVFSMLTDSWLVEGVLNREERIMLSSLIGSALDVLSIGISPEIAQRQVYPWSVMSAPDGHEIKAGRMLSAANAGRISSALVTLMDVLERAGIDIPGFDTSAAHEDEDEKARYVLVFDGPMTREDVAQINKHFNEWLDGDRKGYVIPGGAQVVRLGKDITYNLVNGDSSTDNLKRFVELIAAQDIAKSPYAPLLPSADVFTRFKELADGGMDRPSAYFQAVMERVETLTKEPTSITVPSEDVKINIETPAPEKAADNEHQAGSQDAPTSNDDVLTRIKVLEAELSFMEV